MASDPQLELRVSRLENDRNSIYELITEIRSTQQEHSRRFEGVDQRLDRVDQRFDAVDGRLDGIDQRLDGIGQRFDGIGRRFDAFDRRFDGVEATLAEVVRRLPEPS